MPSPKSDEAELTRLTETLIRILNSRDFSYQNDDGQEFLSHTAPDFEGRFDTQPYTVDLDGQTEIWQQDARDHSALQFTIIELTPRVRRRSSPMTASVYVQLALSGMGDVQYLGACELLWRYDSGDDRWLLFKHVTMRGLLPLDDDAAEFTA